jgi:small GTP-binding protein
MESMESMESLKFKIAVLGSTAVGKSSFLSRVHTNRFNPNLPSTQGSAFHSKTIRFDNKAVRLEFWDTAGQELYRFSTSIVHE